MLHKRGPPTNSVITRSVKRARTYCNAVSERQCQPCLCPLHCAATHAWDELIFSVGKNTDSVRRWRDAPDLITRSSVNSTVCFTCLRRHSAAPSRRFRHRRLPHITCRCWTDCNITAPAQFSAKRACQINVPHARTASTQSDYICKGRYTAYICV